MRFEVSDGHLERVGVAEDCNAAAVMHRQTQ
jgi:hypothetical protein